MRMRVAGWVLLWASTVSAAARTLPVASGDCNDATLRTVARQFATSLSTNLKGQVLDGTEAAQKLKPRPTNSQEELQRQLAMAQSHFYNLQYPKAEQQISGALKEIDLLPPGETRRTLSASANVLYGLILLGGGKGQAADEAFAKVLRVAPSHQLDPDYYSPSTRERFEQVRKKVGQAKRSLFSVQSSPSGAEVFLDGYLQGKTPLTTRLPAGKYQLVVTQGGLSSFPRAVDLTGPEAREQVDLAFEGSVTPTQPLCVSEASSPADPLGAAGKLGAILDMEEVVLVRVRKQSAGAQWLTATLMSVRNAQEVREGGMKIPASDAPGAFDDLVAFIATGRAAPGVVVVEKSASTPPWEPAPAGQSATERSEPARAAGPAWRGKAWIPAAAGGALLVGGTVFYVMARNVEAGLRSRDPGITDIDAAVSRGKAFEGVGMTCLAVGLVGAGAAGAMFFLDRQSEGASVAVVPVPGGAVSMVSARF